MEVSDATAYYMPGCAKCAILSSDSARCTPSHSISTRVTVLLGLMECDGRRTLSGVLREVGQSPSLSGLSRFLAEAPWCSRSGHSQLAEALSGGDAATGYSGTGTATPPAAQASRSPQTAPRDRVCDRGRFDDEQTRAVRKMEGLGKHHSTTSDQRIVGHSLVQGLYMLLDRTCPLAPQLYRQARVCEAEKVPFHEPRSS